MPYVVGLTGGIGSGKSTVCSMLARRGATIVDADAIVHELYAGGDVARRIARRFGESVLAPDGSVDRVGLARAAFADAAARRDLEALVHPEVRRTVRSRIDALRRAGFGGLVVVDAALLVEAEPPYPVDALLVVTAPDALRLERLAARGLSREESARRIAAQIDDSVRRERADAVVVNDASLAELERRVLAALRELERDDAFRSRYTGRSRSESGGGEG